MNQQGWKSFISSSYSAWNMLLLYTYHNHTYESVIMWQLSLRGWCGNHLKCVCWLTRRPCGILQYKIWTTYRSHHSQQPCHKTEPTRQLYILGSDSDGLHTGMFTYHCRVQVYWVCVHVCVCVCVHVYACIHVSMYTKYTSQTQKEIEHDDSHYSVQYALTRHFLMQGFCWRKGHVICCMCIWMCATTFPRLYIIHNINVCKLVTFLAPPPHIKPCWAQLYFSYFSSWSRQ